MLLPIFGILLLLAAVLLLWVSSRQRRESGLPGGRVIYADTSRWGRVEKALFDAGLGLTGKPDYLVEQDDQLIPVEVKSSRIGQSPYDSHIYQLAAYCLLVERTHNRRPAYGILHYPNRTFAVDFTRELEQKTLDILDAMHADMRRKELNRSHEVAARCDACGFRSNCDQSLRI